MHGRKPVVDMKNALGEQFFLPPGTPPGHHQSRNALAFINGRDKEAIGKVELNERDRGHSIGRHGTQISSG
jgi:hypothetical protein